MFEIEPEDGFYLTDSFEALAEQTRNEVEDGVRPTIQTSIDNLDDYDVIFVGYPRTLNAMNIIDEVADQLSK